MELKNNQPCCAVPELQETDVANIERACDVFRMLSEPSRLKIVYALLGGELCVYHILQSVGGTQSALSHQLRVLKDNRVLRARRDGQNVYYSLADEHIKQIVEMGLCHGECGGVV
jgi:DNA-binding transcriptional ArsR family regulator